MADDAEVVVDVDDEVASLIDGYLGRQRAILKTVARAAKEGEPEIARRMGHNLRGTGSMYGFAQLSQFGAERERRASAGDVDGVLALHDTHARWLAAVRWRRAGRG